MSTNRHLKSTPWPLEVDIGFGRGIILTIAVFFGSRLLYWISDHTQKIVLSFFNYTLSNTGIGIEIYNGILVILGFVLVYIVAQRVGKINIRTLLWHTPPSLKQGIKWAFLGFCLSFSFCLLQLYVDGYIIKGYGYYHYSDKSFLYVCTITFIDIAVSGVLAPIKEEISERGILYAALRKKGKIIAYFLSVFWFVFLHVPSYSNLFFNAIIGLTLHHFIFLILMGIITAYIYESTGKLILCVIFHSASNATLTMSSFLYYLITQIIIA